MRELTSKEIDTLEQQGCTAEDWTRVTVDEGFSPEHIRHTEFYGKVQLGRYDADVQISEGFSKHSGICHACLRNVSSNG